MSIIVLGSSGQLATHLRGTVPLAEFWGREQRDMADTAALETALLAARPKAIINAAAWTSVDKAEDEPEAAWRLNAEAPAAAARAASTLGAALVHVSTDYVFDGEAELPYAEDAPTRPLGVYGASKLAGELAVRTLCPRHWILRTSWVFSAHGANFVKTVLRLARGGGPLRIVADQFGQPTYAGDLAGLIGALDVAAEAPKLPFGTFHATGGPVVSWNEFAARIVSVSNALGLLPAPIEVQAISTSEYPTRARRPMRAVLAPSPELGALGGVRFDWTRGLDRTLAALADAREGEGT